MITEFRHIVALVKTMEANVEQLVKTHSDLLKGIERLKLENKELYDKCKEYFEGTTSEVSNTKS